MEHVSFSNISAIQFFGSAQYEYIDVEDEVQDIIEPPDEIQDEAMVLIEIPHETEATKVIDIETSHDKDGKLLVDSPYSTQVQSKTLDISPNISEIPTGNSDGVISKIPVVLAQLVIPINITSFIELPQKVFEVKEINKTLRLKECILLQPTNILFIKGSINNSIEYSTMDLSSSERVSGKIINYLIDIPFETSTAVIFFTEPLKPISNTKEIFQYSETSSSGLNQVSEEFFIEIPFCKLLDSKIIESDNFISSKDPEQGFLQIEERMVIEIRMEILQNQPIVIPPARDNLPIE